MEMKTLRIATYNVHKCRGLDRKVSPARIVEVLRQTDAEIIALQEVLSFEGGALERNQARFIAEQLEMHCHIGETRRLSGGVYGNVLLSRFTMRDVCNYDLSVSGREPRGCLRADIEINSTTVLHIFNVHLGTSFFERRQQGRRLMTEAILNDGKLGGARIVMGDFNEWTRGLTTRLLSTSLKPADPRLHLPRSKTYPGLLPFLHLDHIYFDERLALKSLHLHRSRTALVASDHLPLIADLQLYAHAVGEKHSIPLSKR